MDCFSSIRKRKEKGMQTTHCLALLNNKTFPSYLSNFTNRSIYKKKEREKTSKRDYADI